MQIKIESRVQLINGKTKRKALEDLLYINKKKGENILFVGKGRFLKSFYNLTIFSEILKEQKIKDSITISWQPDRVSVHDWFSIIKDRVNKEEFENLSFFDLSKENQEKEFLNLKFNKRTDKLVSGHVYLEINTFYKDGFEKQKTIDLLNSLPENKGEEKLVMLNGIHFDDDSESYQLRRAIRRLNKKGYYFIMSFDLEYSQYNEPMNEEFKHKIIVRNDFAPNFLKSEYFLGNVDISTENIGELQFYYINGEETFNVEPRDLLSISVAMLNEMPEAVNIKEKLKTEKIKDF